MPHRYFASLMKVRGQNSTDLKIFVWAPRHLYSSEHAAFAFYSREIGSRLYYAPWESCTISSLESVIK